MKGSALRHSVERLVLDTVFVANLALGSVWLKLRRDRGDHVGIAIGPEYLVHTEDWQ